MKNLIKEGYSAGDRIYKVISLKGQTRMNSIAYSDDFFLVCMDVSRI